MHQYIPDVAIQSVLKSNSMQCYLVWFDFFGVSTLKCSNLLVFLVNYTNCSLVISIMAAPLASRAAVFVPCLSVRVRVCGSCARWFSSSNPQRHESADQRQTHFGFQSVSEEEKEHKGCVNCLLRFITFIHRLALADELFDSSSFVLNSAG